MKVKITCEGIKDFISLDELVVIQGNLKTLSKENAGKLWNSIKEHGFCVPIFIWLSGKKYNILDGTQRVTVLREKQEEGWEIPPLPVVYIKAPTRKKAKAILLKITSQYGTITKEGFVEFTQDIDFSGVMDVHYDAIDVDLVLNEPGETEDDDEVPESEVSITEEGDLWELGGEEKHRLLCGDCTDIEQVGRLLLIGIVDIVYTDPPYGIDIQKNKKIGGSGPTHFGKIVGRNIVKSKSYKIIKGDKSIETAKKFIEVCNSLGIKNIILWGGNYFTEFLTPSSCWIIWDKKMTGKFSRAEMAWTSYKKGGVKIYDVLWNGLSREGNRTDELKQRVCATQKPVGLSVKILTEYKGEVIFDGFLGSGSTLIACEKTKRTCYGMDIEPHYIDVTINRYINWCEKNNVECTIKRNGKPFDKERFRK